MNHFEPPAELPAPLKDQLKALQPYINRIDLKENGGFRVDMSVPKDLITDFNPGLLFQHGITVTGNIDPLQLVFGGKMYRPRTHVHFTLEYK